MTWIYLPDNLQRCPSSQDMGGSHSPSDLPDSTQGPSATLSGTDTARNSSSSGSEMTPPLSIPLPSGTTSKVSTDDPGVEQWISCQPGSRANLTQMRGYGNLPEGFPMTETSGPIPSESLGKWDQDSSFWRTSQASLWEVMDGHHMGAPWLESWPKQGMTLNGELYPLPMLERHTSETGGGSWPTPTGSDQIPRTTTTFLRYRGWDLATAAAKWHIPTPTSADVYTGNLESSQQSDDSMHSVSLPDFVNRWPTPTPWQQQESIENWTERRAREKEKHRNGNGFGIPLDMAARMFPTPTSRDHKDGDAHSCQNVPVNGLLVREVHMLPTPSSAYAVGSSG